MSLLVISCTSMLNLDDSLLDNNNIEIKFQSQGISTRATAANACESYLSHIDVVIYNFANTEAPTPFHHERIYIPNTPQGTVSLQKTKDDFIQGQTYKVFVIANSTISESAFYDSNSELIGYNTFIKLDQTDERIHLTGVDFDIQNPHYPQMFLMDGVTSQIINDGTTDKVTLEVTLKRAAAKFKITITPGDNVELSPELMAQSQGYMLRNMPIRSTLVADGGYPSTLNGNYWESPTISQTPYSTMFMENGKYKLQIIAYCYSHSWTSSEAFDKGTSLVMMIPLKYNNQEYLNNYYQLSINKRESDGSHLIKRNTYYDLRINLNAPGAEDYHKPEEIKDMYYFTAPWTTENMNISGENPVKYLKLNKNKLYMYNIAEDESSIYFSSSSPLTITLKKAYYINKYGTEIDVTSSSNITATTEENAISGNISINSTIPTNNTILYFRLKAINQDGLEEYIDVEQYPLIYITNSLPWYSYRDDYYYRTNEGHTFDNNITKNLASGDNPTTYRYDGDHIVSVAPKSVDISTGEIKYNYYLDADGFTYSKNRGDKLNNSEYYNIKYNSYIYFLSSFYKYSRSAESHNVRNYHIRMMATDEEYILASPRLDDRGYTAGDALNAQLVSPSFVIASRLGAMHSNHSSLKNLTNEQKLLVFADHCKNYVEVDDINDNKSDPVVVYNNWRLPTEAELNIIIQLQGESLSAEADAIDYLLNGHYYMSASGPVYNSKNDGEDGQVAIRCVRDAF